MQTPVAEVTEIIRLKKWLKLMSETGAADDMDPKAAWANAALAGWSVDDLGSIPFKGDEVEPKE